MSQLTRADRRVRVAFLPIVIVIAIVLAAAAGFIVGSQLAKTSPATTGSVSHSTAFVRAGSDLNSEYLVQASREWAPVPMTAEQASVVAQLNSEYLLGASTAWFTPMTHTQAQIRAELNSEYLRESALGW